MKILLINDHARVTGGADVHCFALERLLGERGHEVQLLSTSHPGNIIDSGAFIRQIVDRASRDSLSLGAAAGVLVKSCWNREAAAAAERIFADFRPDLVHTHKLYPQLSVAPIVAAARHSVPVVQTAHDYEFVSASITDDEARWYDRDESRATYRLLNTVLFQIKRSVHIPRVSSWITVSHDLAEVYRTRGGIESRPLPNFVIAGGPVPSRRNRAGALYVGRLSSEKGIERVIEVARRFPELPVTVAGLGPLADLLSRSAEAIPNLSFDGALERDAIDARMRSARLVLMPGTWREPAGLVALEAMSAGTPVIAYDHGGLAEYIKSSGGGLVCAPGLDALTQKVRVLLDDDSLWQELSERGARAARTKYSPDAYLDHLESIYRSAAASGRPRPL